MHGDTDNVYAVIVSAETFELIDTSGNVVGEFGAVPADPIWSAGPRYGIRMDHLDPAQSDSILAWSTSTPAESTEFKQSAGIIGPSDVADVDGSDASQLVLSRNPAPPNGFESRSFSLQSGNVGGGIVPANVQGTTTATDSFLQLQGERVVIGAVDATYLALRPAYMMTGIGTARQSVASLTLTGAWQNIPGCVLSFPDTEVGDIFSIRVSADCRGDGGGGGVDFALTEPWINGNQVFGTQTIFSHNGGAGPERYTVSQTYSFTEGVGGTITFQLRGIRLGPNGTMATWDHTSMTVTRYSTR